MLDVTYLYTGSSLPSVIPPIQELKVVGSHFYVPNPLAPSTFVPEFRLRKGDYFIGTRTASVPSVPSSYSVAQALLQNIQPGSAGGSLADWVVRTNVIGGVTPAVLNICTAGQAIAIPYRAHYLFFRE